MIAVVLAVSQAAAVTFAPPVDRMIGVVVTETREFEGKLTTATVERRVTFRRRPDGTLFAEVDTLPQRGDPAGGDRVGRVALSALVGRRLIIDLDATGQATRVADQDALWSLIVDGIAREIDGQKLSPERRAAAGKMLEPLRSLPPTGKVAMLADAVTPLVGVAITKAGVRDVHSVTMAMRSPDGVSIDLSGTERSYRNDAGVMVVERALTGSNGDRRVTFSEQRRADSMTGLALDARREVEWVTAGSRLKQVRTCQIDLNSAAHAVNR